MLGIVETAWALQKALQLISDVCCGCRSTALTCEQLWLALVMMLFTRYKGVFTCHPDVRQPFTLSREETELRLRWGILGDGSSLHRRHLACLCFAHNGCSSPCSIWSPSCLQITVEASTGLCLSVTWHAGCKRQWEPNSLGGVPRASSGPSHITKLSSEQYSIGLCKGQAPTRFISG